jgi:hypothetical protein
MPQIPFLSQQEDLEQQEDLKVIEITPMKRPTEILRVCNMMDNISATIAPPEFQRPEAWTSRDCKSYFQSFLLNRLEGSFVFVDLIRASSSKKLLSSQDKAKEYFVELMNQGYNYITLDGNNRFTWLDKLFNDMYTIPKGTYKIIVGDSVDDLVIGCHNNVFSKLTSCYQHELRTRDVVVNTYTEIGYMGLSDVFLNVNAGCPLNRQEKRNAFGTPYADFVRKLREEFAPLLIRIHGTEYKKRLKCDEWLLDTIIFSKIEKTNIIGITQSTKDRVYYGDLPDVNQVSQNFSFIQNLIDEIDEEKIRPNSVTNVFWLISNYDGEIDDDLIVEFFDLNEELYRDTKVVNDSGDTFRWACGGNANKNNELKLRELSKVLEAVSV